MASMLSLRNRLAAAPSPKFARAIEVLPGNLEGFLKQLGK
jgi:hypothetical protein